MKTKYQEESTEGSNANTNELQQKQGETLLSQQDSSSNKWGDKEVGSFWVRQTKKGDQYLSGKVVIDGKVHNLHIYKNAYYEGNGQPMFKGYKV